MSRVVAGAHQVQGDIRFVTDHPAVVAGFNVEKVAGLHREYAAIEAIREFGAVYLMAIGGAAYLVSKAIHGSRLLAFEDLGMEAIYEFDVRDMPVTVAVDAKGTSVHQTGPAEWQQRIANIPILQ